MEKLQGGPLFLMFALLMATFVMPVAASGTDRVNFIKLTANSSAVSYFSNGKIFVEVCHVRTKGGRLNVRNANSKIIARLLIGIEVNAINHVEESTWVEITAYVGSKSIRGLVEDSFIACN